MEQYENYRESGIPWLGDIPSHWEFKKISYIGHVYNGNSINEHIKGEKYSDLSIDGLLYLSTKDIDKNTTMNYDVNVKIPHNEQGFKIAYKNTPLICSEGGSAGKKIGYTAQNIYFVNKLFAIKLVNYVNSKFVFYSYQSSYFQQQFASNLTGLIPGVKVDVFNNFKILLPPIKEQKEIVRYLDSKIGIVDKLISHKKKQVKLFKEKKQAIINDVVSKGLNPDVKLKDTNIEYIGKIPKHWKVGKLKYLTTKIVDGTHFTPKYKRKGIPFLRVTDLLAKTIDLKSIKYISKEEHNELIKRCNPEKGDLLLSKNGTIGRTMIVNLDFEFSIFVSLCLIKLNKELLLVNWLEYIIHSDLFKQQISRDSKTTSVTNLHLEMINEMRVVTPPLAEQQEIAKYLDHKTSIIDELIEKINKSIELLEEYKISLISHVVTGKMKI